MAQNKNKSIIELPYTVSRIGPKSVYDGNLKFKTSISIQGLVKGNITGGELLVVYPNGRVEGDVFVDYILVAGEVQGNMHAKKGVLLFEPSKIRGTILSAIIRMQSGVDFEGECNYSTEEGLEIFDLSREAFYTSLFDKLIHEIDEIDNKLNTKN